MKTSGLHVVAITVVLTALATVGRADVVTLSNGSRIVGIVERLDDGKLTIATEFAGTLEVDAAMVTSIVTEDSVNVGLTTGDRLVGVAGPPPQEGEIVVQTEVGEVTAALVQTEAIWLIGEKSPEQLHAEKEAEAKVGKWSFTLEGGVSFTEGNKEILEAQGGLELKRQSSIDLLRFYATGMYREDHKVRSAAEVIGGVYYEYLLTDRFFLYGKSEAEYDEFENLDLRFTAGLGGGYYWLKQPDHELKTRAGVGYLHESFMDGTSRDDPQAEVGLDYMVDLLEWLKFTHSATYYPTFESVRDYRLVFDTAFLMPLGTSDKWKLKLGAKHEYDPIPQPGLHRLDQTYYANILLELK